MTKSSAAKVGWEAVAGMGCEWQQELKSKSEDKPSANPIITNIDRTPVSLILAVMVSVHL